MLYLMKCCLQSNFSQRKLLTSFIKVSSCRMLKPGKAHFSHGLNVGHHLRPSHIPDYNFQYFRSNEAYRASAVQLDENVSSCVISGSEFEYFFSGEVKIDALMKYLRVRDNVMKLSSSQVKDLMHLMVNLGAESENFPLVLKWLDEKCAVSVARWSLDLTLYVLDSWYVMLGPKAFKKYYFAAVLSFLNRKVQTFSKNHVIQILYFIGLAKISPQFLLCCLESKLERWSPGISDEEWAIACVSFFKTSTKIKSEIILKKSCQVAKKFIEANERFHLTSMLKSLRQARYYDEELWHMLERYVKDNYTLFNFVECSNFLAAFSAQNVYQDDVFKCVEMHSVCLLFDDEKMMAGSSEITLTTHPSVHFRVKDLARLLWAMVTVGHCPESETLEAYLKCIQQRLEAGEYQKQPHVLVDTLHSLALINCYPQNLLTKVLNSKYLEHLRNIGLDKPMYQFYFLFKSAEVESPESIVDRALGRKVSRILSPIPKSIAKEKNERSGFKELIGLLEAHYSFTSFKCDFVIPHFVIAGFLVKNPKNLDKNNFAVNRSKETFPGSSGSTRLSREREAELLEKVPSNETEHVCLEILDESVCVKNTTQPLGLMKAKIRQLKKLSYSVVEVTPREIHEVTTLPKTEIPEKMRMWFNW